MVGNNFKQRDTVYKVYQRPLKHTGMTYFSSHLSFTIFSRVALVELSMFLELLLEAWI